MNADRQHLYQHSPERMEYMYIEPVDRITTQEIASLCGVSLNTVRRWARTGYLPEGMKLSRRVRYWKRGDIMAFMGASTAE